ncbi:hypothetical protein EDD18DRAFT_1106436 [Armillaria luteobubalina]|uniref:Holliday junction resolvase Gen1 C-terminal domain-containing protein n=1 Tax=Armillaria luteobubalina TaxID=153913 RepID=A0AA39TMU0_9AGAR|nr:hypothetical protein EDD18DRAFT_1106436 [Armillaria luteobubalina]
MSHLAAFGGDEFTEWGTHFIIDRRVQDLIWEAAVIRVLRQAPLEAGDRERSQRHASGNEDRHIRQGGRYIQQCQRNAFVNRDSFQTASPVVPIPNANPFITKIVGSRRHVSTDYLLEYGVEVHLIQLIHLTDPGIKESGLRKPRVKRKRTKGREGLAAEPAITRSGVSVASDFIAPCELSELEPLSQSTQEDDGRGFNFTLPNPDMSDVEEDDDVIIVEGMKHGVINAHIVGREILTAPLETEDDSSLFGDISNTTSRGSRHETIMDDLFDQVMMVGRQLVPRKRLVRARSPEKNACAQSKRPRITSNVWAHSSPASSQTVIDMDAY